MGAVGYLLGRDEGLPTCTVCAPLFASLARPPAPPPFPSIPLNSPQFPSIPLYSPPLEGWRVAPGWPDGAPPVYAPCTTSSPGPFAHFRNAALTRPGSASNSPRLCLFAMLHPTKKPPWRAVWHVPCRRYTAAASALRRYFAVCSVSSTVTLPSSCSRAIKTGFPLISGLSSMPPL